MSGRGGFFRWTSLRDERGVPMLRLAENCSAQDLRRMELWMPIAIAAMCVFPGPFGLACRWFGTVRQPMPPWTTWLYAGLVGALFTLFALNIVRGRLYILSLMPLSTVAERHGLDEASAAAELARLSIRPAFCLNGVDVYDPATVDPAAILLRPAGNVEIDADRLLRPDGDERQAA